jgi:hypothetical protein
MVVPIFSLQNRARFFNAVGLTYQLPPPEYFNRASLTVYSTGVNEHNETITKNPEIKRYLLFAITLLLSLI